MTGEIPGFLGPGFADLVATPEEFHDWVRTGAATRVVNQLFALRFLEAQRTSMPAFPKEVLTDEELAAIERWVKAARAQPSATR
jgi:mono/diheme cytochrome c family protein